MAASEVNLEDFSVYAHLTDEELLQIAVERSLSDKHHQADTDQRSAPRGPPPEPRNPEPPTDLPRREQVQNCANPPTALTNFLYRPLNRESSPLLKVIMDGDTEALMDLVRQRPSSLTEPCDQGWVALHEAAFYGQLQCVRILLRADPSSVNICTLKNETALLLAAVRGNASCVEFLLKHGANVNTANKLRETPLFVACENPNEEVVELLLRYGAQVNLSSSQGESPLHEACRLGGPMICRRLLDAGANLKARNVYQIQPLFSAAQNGNAETLQLLVQRGADVNEQAGDGASPLYEACKNGHFSVVQALLTLKADANRATNSGLLPLHVAVRNNHKRIVSLLIPLTSRVRIRTCGISPLHIAADRNRDEILELLIESGFDVNAELSEEHSRMYEDRRSTALYFSVSNGNLEAAETLLEAGANPNLDIFNPLLIAVRLGWIDMAELLVRYGADVNAQMSTQPSSFPSAILLGMESLPILKLLLDNGCNARRCFRCEYGLQPHPAVAPSRRPIEELQVNQHSQPQRCIQYCEAISSSCFCQISGPIISMLLDYVGHVRLCSRLLEILENRSDWVSIKLKAAPPHPLMQLCRLKIRFLLGVQRLKLIHTLPLPVRLIRFLRYDVCC
ncbi:ankyrin repeat and SOCS box protein 2-like isoform X1 [Poecilia latipinna]|uniref:ankyrin repeat and SOCS box protein 2-like isoform X1 n=1 Tax=Poecilia latipinna TaxID=48699 RepID=UPI00072DCBAF|nr:PREDICTED: ankyrin repeat and SOCS box protein 2-like isoform X1 [Poecilia latipinna]XP_014871566.1 PREDICTED: ankyrin repeat and SOCS box protein 2-like isoform X1 [Poecilia latipinna]XP_014871567.1 PREDICTED: ankyrin repeat and SOCS box protein 2-like isoform X1 [Poecilia latipinna]